MACLDQVIAAVGHCRGRRRFSLGVNMMGGKLGTTYRAAAQGCLHRMRKPGAKRLDAGVLRTTLLDALKSEGTAGGCGRF